MMPRALRFLALTALFAVTGLAAMLVLFSVETAIGELPYWGLHQLGRRLIWFWLILAHAPLRGLVSPLAWISVSGALYLLGREPLQTSAVWRTVRAALGLSLGLCALVPIYVALAPALSRTSSPFERPLLSAPLYVYCLVAPWVLGRLERRAQMKSAS